jgi:hypothetical protein
MRMGQRSSYFFWCENIGAKAALKILVKLTPGQMNNFPNANDLHSIFVEKKKKHL